MTVVCRNAKKRFCKPFLSVLYNLNFKIQIAHDFTATDIVSQIKDLRLKQQRSDVMKKTVLFDLDGTLLPMGQDEFIARYMDELSSKMETLGYDKKSVIAAVWSGTKAMILNDGTKTNETRFWDTFAAKLGEDVRKTEAPLEDFYRNEFNRIKAVSTPPTHSREVIELLKNKKYSLVLATNPVFPRIAVEARLKWIGIDINVFDYVTSYENCTYCKPNLGYYREILQRIGKEPQECFMVGNNVKEDMCTLELGMEAFLVTDNLENAEGADISCYRNGSMQEFYRLAETFE